MRKHLSQVNKSCLTDEAHATDVNATKIPMNCFGKKVIQDWTASCVDRIPSATPGAEPPRDAKDSGSARSHSTHLETSSSNRP